MIKRLNPLKLTLVLACLFFTVNQSVYASNIGRQTQSAPCEFIVSIKKSTSDNITNPSIKSVGGQCENGIKVKLQSNMGDISANMIQQGNGYKISLQNDNSSNPVVYNFSEIEMQFLIAALKASLQAPAKA